MNTLSLPAETHIGYAHLVVRDLQQALIFYRDLLGLREAKREDDTVYLSATGNLPYQIILTGKPESRPKPPRTTGLYHIAIRLPSRTALARLFRRLIEHRYQFQGFSDHGVSEALYLADPEGNGLELYRDRPRADWPRANGEIAMSTEPLDIDDLLAQAGQDTSAWNGIDPGTDIGHMHLHVSDLGKAQEFWNDLIGFDMIVDLRRYGALFVSAGGYHHHLGLNVWAGQGAPPPPQNSTGLRLFSLVLPDAAAVSRVVERLEAAGRTVEKSEIGIIVRDADGNAAALVTA